MHGLKSNTKLSTRAESLFRTKSIGDSPPLPVYLNLSNKSFSDFVWNRTKLSTSVWRRFAVTEENQRNVSQPVLQLYSNSSTPKPKVGVKRLGSVRQNSTQHEQAWKP